MIWHRDVYDRSYVAPHAGFIVKNVGGEYSDAKWQLRRDGSLLSEHKLLRDAKYAAEENEDV